MPRSHQAGAKMQVGLPTETHVAVGLFTDMS